MLTVRFPVPEEVEERMDEHDVDWSALLRGRLREELNRLESRDVADAVATSERLSRAIDPDEATTPDAATTVSEVRDTRYRDDSSR